MPSYIARVSNTGVDFNCEPCKLCAIRELLGEIPRYGIPIGNTINITQAVKVECTVYMYSVQQICIWFDIRL